MLVPDGRTRTLISGTGICTEVTIDSMQPGTWTPWNRGGLLEVWCYATA